MEDTHWTGNSHLTTQSGSVLILVLMEDTHWGYANDADGNRILVLILVLMEDTHWDGYKNPITPKDGS